MKVKFNRTLQFATAGLVATLTVAGVAVADLPKAGRVDFNSCWSGVSNVLAFSKTHVAFSFELTGANRSNPPGGFLDKTTFRCVGINTLFAGKRAGTALCEVLDRDGDKALSRFETEGSKATRTHIAGTGKYDGMEISSSAEQLGPFPTIKPGTFQNCNHQTGTYKLK